MAEANREGKPRRCQYFSLYLCSFSLCLCSFVHGCTLAWTSPTLVKLKGDENILDHHPTTHEEGMITSSMLVGVFLAPFYSGWASDKIGRKLTTILTHIPLLVGLAILPISNRVWHLYVSRFLCGLSSGSSFSILPLYIAEISVRIHRGKLLLISFIMLNGGTLFTYCVGPYVSVALLPIIFLVPTVAFFILVIFIMPESPLYLLANKKNEKAMKVLKYLWKETPEDELVEMERFVAQNEDRSIKDYWTMITNKSLRKRIVMVLMLLFFQQASGNNGILFYTQELMGSTKTDIPDDLAAIGVGCANTLAALTAPLFIDSFGRKCLLYVSATGCGISLFFVGLFFCLKVYGGPYEYVLWLPLLSLIVFLLSYSLGLGNIPLVILGEILPQKYKAPGMAICISALALFCYAVAWVFPYAIKYPGFGFIGFSAIMVLCLVYLFFCVPETKGMSLLAIQHMLDNTSEPNAEETEIGL